MIYLHAMIKPLKYTYIYVYYLESKTLYYLESKALYYRRP